MVAVSGGVDSMTLLYLLVNSGRDYELIVSHCNHGIRPDSDQDETLVKNTAREYGLEYRSTDLHLGPKASEAEARSGRYKFLRKVRQDEGAKAIITAHHLDDRLETMLMNKQRGAGWYGLSPLHETDLIKRPLLEISKREIIEYARENNLKWREDPTNIDPEYTLRNYLRGNLDREAALEELRRHDEYRRHRLEQLRSIFDKVVTTQNTTTSISRAKLLELDGETARDVLYLVLRRYSDMLNIDRDAVYRLEHFCKTARVDKRLVLSESLLAVTRDRDVKIDADLPGTR